MRYVWFLGSAGNTTDPILASFSASGPGPEVLFICSLFCFSLILTNFVSCFMFHLCFKLGLPVFAKFLTLPDSRPFAGLGWPQIVKDHKNIARVQHCWLDDITTLNSRFGLCLLIFVVFLSFIFLSCLPGQLKI